MSQPLFTIATITYNSSKWVRQAIESVLASSYFDIEYLISDDCSTDDTWQIIQEYNDPRIISWRNDSNLGEYPNRNKVLNEAKGKFILFIDGDDILYKNTLRNLSEYIEYFPECEMIWGVLTPLNKYALLPYQFDPLQTLQLLYDYSNYIGVIGFTETLFSVNALHKVGGFSNTFKIGDIYIRKKMALTCKVLFVPLGFGYWRSRPGQASSNLGLNYMGTVEAMEIDMLILNDPNNPLSHSKKLEFEQYLKSAFLRRAIRNILFKAHPIKFIKILSRLGFSFKDFIKIFNYSVPFGPVINDIASPLFNDFNFIDKYNKSTSFSNSF